MLYGARSRRIEPDLRPDRVLCAACLPRESKVVGCQVIEPKFEDEPVIRT